ncbi:kinase-like domain-containing protein [Aspergillus pseudoustus]|uniref:Kinase-like domain-containing protein n=1 Tax=Aspergillus pseudoustus TaxID=1810923 RepID=A0ABR4J4R4_9EURO
MYSSMSTMNQPQHSSPIDAEPLHRYQEGGYHPTLLGDSLGSGRYKILHKLGWGGFSTAWAAKDTSLEGVYVAVKICIAERKHENVIEAKFPSRLPGKLAKDVAKQRLVALNYLHKLGICHGDLHTRSPVFTICLDEVSEEKFLETLGHPEVSPVQRRDGGRLEHGMPRYSVRPAAPQTRLWNSAQTIKLIDFDKPFARVTVPQTLHTPLVVRAPEVIFQDRLDQRVDLWSMGCMLFELFTDQPPFDSFMITPSIHIGQMREMASDDLPRRWQKMADMICKDDMLEPGSPGLNLQEWLEEIYFDGPHNQDLGRDGIARLGQIIARLLCFEPSARASVKDVLDEA